jgi:predicted DNA-binding mobile mystery protein A
MNPKKLQLAQLSKKLATYEAMAHLPSPTVGWLKAIRVTLGMTLQQLANKLSISKQSVQEIEVREKEGTVTIKTLREVANALDMHLVYAFVPKDGSIDQLIERKARELAIQIVGRTAQNMKLEDQEISYERLEEAIEERTAELKKEMPKALWD